MTTDLNQSMDTFFDSKPSVIARDLKLNLKRLLEESALSKEEALLTLLATATSVEQKALAGIAKAQLKILDLAPELIQEAEESAAMMGMLNTYYRFKHMVAKDDDYRSAGLRMTALSKPVLGKERFEMLAFSVSVLNGCENCIRSHESALRSAGLSVDKIHDLARIAAVTRGIKALIVE